MWLPRKGSKLWTDNISCAGPIAFRAMFPTAVRSPLDIAAIKIAALEDLSTERSNGIEWEEKTT